MVRLVNRLFVLLMSAPLRVSGSELSAEDYLSSSGTGLLDLVDVIGAHDNHMSSHVGIPAARWTLCAFGSGSVSHCLLQERRGQC